MEIHPSAAASLRIVVDPDIEKLNALLHSRSNDWQTISVGREVSALLLAINEGEYLSATNQWIDERFRESKSDLFLCCDIDLLFTPSLKLDPLAIFQQISRHKKLVVLWPGSYQARKFCS